MKMVTHQYIVRDTGQPRSEFLVGDRIISALYSTELKYSNLFHSVLSSAQFTAFLAFMNFDCPVTRTTVKSLELMGADFSECLEPADNLKTMRSIFERKIRYWELRPILENDAMIVSPADSRVVVGSLEQHSMFFLKKKFFSFEELLGCPWNDWSGYFEKGSFAIFRLTPEKYHYNHTPVAGIIVDFYEVAGKYNSCNPSATIGLVDAYSKNKRVVTIIDTDVPGGTGVGLVAMIEIVALMIGKIDQAYSEVRYQEPSDLAIGMYVKKGVPKSLFRPGSSTVVLLFQHGRVKFAADLISNQERMDVDSRFSLGFGRPVVETDLKVRSSIACRSNVPA